MIGAPEMVARLKALRLHGMVAAFDEVIDSVTCQLPMHSSREGPLFA